MKEYIYFRFSLLLPLIVPIFTYVLFMLGVGGSLLFFISMSLLVAGVPYALLAISLLLWSFKKGVNNFKKILKLLPIILGIIILPTMLIVELFYDSAHNYGSIFVTWLWVFIFTLIFGYMYVFIVFKFAKFGLKAGWILKTKE